MIESGRFYKTPDKTDKGTVVTFEITGNLPKDYGNEGLKGPLPVRVYRGNRTSSEFIMFYKYVRLGSSFTGNPETSGEAILEKYQWLKTHDFPVVPTLRYDPEKELLLMTMLEDENNIIFDKHHQFPFKINNFDQVIAEAKRIIKAAYMNGRGVYLPAEALALVVNLQTRNARVIILDIGVFSYRLDGSNNPLTDCISESISEFVKLLRLKQESTKES